MKDPALFLEFWKEGKIEVRMTSEIFCPTIMYACGRANPNFRPISRVVPCPHMSGMSLQTSNYIRSPCTFPTSVEMTLSSITLRSPSILPRQKTFSSVPLESAGEL